MATVERPARPVLSLSLLFLLAALLAFIAAFCVAEAWLTKGTYQEWIAAGFIFTTLAKIL
jgi:hypothetical protein